MLNVQVALKALTIVLIFLHFFSCESKFSNDNFHSHEKECNKIRTRVTNCCYSKHYSDEVFGETWGKNIPNGVFFYKYEELQCFFKVFLKPYITLLQ